jgi:hypothetical protein
VNPLKIPRRMRAVGQGLKIVGDCLTPTRRGRIQSHEEYYRDYLKNLGSSSV